MFVASFSFQWRADVLRGEQRSAFCCNFQSEGNKSNNVHLRGQKRKLNGRGPGWEDLPKEPSSGHYEQLGTDWVSQGWPGPGGWWEQSANHLDWGKQRQLLSWHPQKFISSRHIMKNSVDLINVITVNSWRQEVELFAESGWHWRGAVAQTAESVSCSPSSPIWSSWFFACIWFGGGQAGKVLVL